MLGSTEGRATEDAAGLAGAIDALLALDPDTLDDRELAALAVELHRQQSRLAAATTRVTAALDARGVWGEDGSRSCGAWLARRCRLPLGQARAEVRLGRRLSTMPETRAAFGAGDITARHAAVLGSLNAGRTAALFARDEALLVDDAQRLSWPEFCVAIDYWRQHADPDGVERDAEHDEAARRLHLSPGLRGTGILDGLLTPLARATVPTALGRIEQKLFAAAWAQAPARHWSPATATAPTPAATNPPNAARVITSSPGPPGDRQRPTTASCAAATTTAGAGTTTNPTHPTRPSRHQIRCRAPTPTLAPTPGSTGSKPGEPTCKPPSSPNKTNEPIAQQDVPAGGHGRWPGSGIHARYARACSRLARLGRRHHPLGRALRAPIAQLAPIRVARWRSTRHAACSAQRPTGREIEALVRLARIDLSTGRCRQCVRTAGQAAPTRPVCAPERRSRRRCTRWRDRTRRPHWRLRPHVRAPRG